MRLEERIRRLGSSSSSPVIGAKVLSIVLEFFEECAGKIPGPKLLGAAPLSSVLALSAWRRVTYVPWRRRATYVRQGQCPGERLRTSSCRLNRGLGYRKQGLSLSAQLAVPRLMSPAWRHQSKTPSLSAWSTHPQLAVPRLTRYVIASRLSFARGLLSFLLCSSTRNTKRLVEL
ncbi:hypothetical protein B296_00021893 [Ensete ventricosum]|uniref:Uncharacterized protein n=1 Tax=Ensete ventricosum TaxID=4639 RepID=A0A426YL04_ENSVE|nr:hypothetical protein B296_00021893 [Ensete ventricosum]